MGTRSNTVVIDRGTRLVNMYRQFDGYLSGHGKELGEFLSQYTLVNGLVFEEERKVANGAGCLAALMISHFKGDKPGGIYLEPVDTELDNDYAYLVKLDTFSPSEGVSIEVLESGEHAFEGTLAEFVALCAQKEE